MWVLLKQSWAIMSLTEASFLRKLILGTLKFRVFPNFRLCLHTFSSKSIINTPCDVTALDLAEFKGQPTQGSHPNLLHVHVLPRNYVLLAHPYSTGDSTDRDYRCNCFFNIIPIRLEFVHRSWVLIYRTYNNSSNLIFFMHNIKISG